jgi:hypothetical protein
VFDMLYTANFLLFVLKFKLMMMKKGKLQGPARRALQPPKQVLEESEDEYRRCVYGTSLDNDHLSAPPSSQRKGGGTVRKMSKRLSRSLIQRWSSHW